MTLVYRSIFKNSGYQVVPAVTTRAAEVMLEHVQPAAIILDIVLRSEDTWGLMARLKEDPRTSQTPIVIISTIEDQAKAYHLGADDYVVKPFERSVLIDKLNRLTRRPSVKRMLLIDDDERARYILQQRLKDIPLQFTECATGAEGVARAISDQPDVIFLDLEMPDMTGFDVLDRLKSEPASNAIPVVVVTSMVLTDADRRRLDGKAVAVLSKGDPGHLEIRDTLRSTLKELELLKEIH
jgi:CheY-like chemotaxis protein